MQLQHTTRLLHFLHLICKWLLSSKQMLQGPRLSCALNPQLGTTVKCLRQIFGVSCVLIRPCLLVGKGHATPWAPTPAPGMKSLPQSSYNILQIRNSNIGIRGRVLGWIWNWSLRGESTEVSGSDSGGHWGSAVNTTVNNSNGSPGIGARSTRTCS